jgi:hypothetical protein
MAAATSERLIVPISPTDKRAVERKAAAGKMSMAEFTRRAVLKYDPRQEEEQIEAQLRAVLAAFGTLHAQTIAQLERTDAALDTALAHFADKRRR